MTVWWDGRAVGLLRLDQHGDMGFAYDADWLADTSAPAISISLPKQAEPYGRRETRQFFAGLLPDEAQRVAVARALGVSRENDFGLLEELGGDVAGALTLWPQGEVPPEPDPAATAEPLEDRRLIEIIDMLPSRPLLAGTDGVRLSLAGAQPKLPVVLVDGRVALPAPGQPTTHILKPPLDRYPASTENEAFAMQLADALGLEVARAEPRRAEAHTYLLVERYDRATRDGRLYRLHQEDFCQALGIAPEHKYAAEGGPTFATGFELVRRACRPPAHSVLRFGDAAIFNVIVGNADAHGKNFSLLHAPGGIRLAPLYDLMCTVAYPGVAVRMAMKVAGRSTLDEFDSKTWDQFSSAVRIAPSFLRRRVRELATAALDHADDVAAKIADQGFDRSALADFAGIVQTRTERLLSLEKR